MVEMDLVGVRVEMPGHVPVVVLREVAGHRILPIWIGQAEGAAISQAHEGVVPPKPLTHDLLLDVVTGLGHRIAEVRITELDQGTFIGELVVDDHIIPARPSDAIALAARCGAAIQCAEAVLDAAGIEVPEEQDDEVEKFREFLDHVTPEDFTGDEPGSPSSAP